MVRRKLVLLLTDRCARLPQDLGLAARVGLALEPRAFGEFLDQRIEWLATQLQRDPRTARRRIDQAFSLLAERLTGQQRGSVGDNPYAPEGWFVESLDALLRLDLDPPQLTEVRQIVAAIDGLDEIVVLLSAPQAGHPRHGLRLDAEMVFGGEIIEERREAGGHLHLIVRLPRPLELGECHSYSVQFKSYPRQLMQPYYVMNPYRRCDYFRVRARFGAAAKPATVWRLNGTPPHVVADFHDNDDRLALDSIGEVFLEFRHLTQGLCYGLQWTNEKT
ncbi:hypothetical protein [Nocardia farcinica]|uniref:hypothetical protein n=1 Tax=Nocardia farcinica TaxID=37329 RepID=UPI002457CBC8|nr:hypothetical protein [Nocardia farcinica]